MFWALLFFCPLSVQHLSTGRVIHLNYGFTRCFACILDVSIVFLLLTKKECLRGMKKKETALCKSLDIQDSWLSYVE